MKQGKTAVIIASRPVTAGMLRYVPGGAFVIAADAGWQRAGELGLHVDLAVGDFDSSPVPHLAGEVLRLPAEKDDTDTHFAVKQALGRGFERLVLLGALGGRPDHHLANLQSMLHAAMRGVWSTAACEGVEVHCMGAGMLRLARAQNRYVSVFAAGGTTTGVCLRGLKYPLDGAVLTPDVPLGASNEFAGDEAQVECASGCLYVMLAGDGRP